MNTHGENPEVFTIFLEGYIGVVNIFCVVYTFLSFYCIFINKFCGEKNLNCPPGYFSEDILVKLLTDKTGRTYFSR